MLERFPLAFDTASPETDETALPGETPAQLVTRLSLEKALSVANREPGAIVIGSDQVAECEGAIVGKPGTVQNARKQLMSFSGRKVVFLSAFAIVHLDRNFTFERTVPTEVVFRKLGGNEIDRYLSLDKPLDCAGSFRSEANGPALLDRMRSDDPTAIMGLPLIALAEGLRAAGVAIP